MFGKKKNVSENENLECRMTFDELNVLGFSKLGDYMSKEGKNIK